MTDTTLVVAGGESVDSESGATHAVDIAIAGGSITRVAPAGTLSTTATDTIDARGLLVLPGLVDLHVHLSENNAGRVGHAMLARAGVTTALDLTGPSDETVRLARTHGAGLTIGVVEALGPEVHLPRHPSSAQITDALSAAVARGAIGVKLHVDAGWGPEETAAIIAEAVRLRLWVAAHCGTTATASDLTGLAETLLLADDQPIHIAHVNSYCRGEVDDPAAEAARAVDLLRNAPHARSESYLDRVNAVWGEFRNDRSVSPRLGAWLEGGGFSPDRDGAERAIEVGWAGVVVQNESTAHLTSGADGLRHYTDASTRIPLCLPVNPAVSRVALATARNTDGRFAVDALATDGGGLPRNSTLRAGLALVELGFLTLAEFVTKASTTPARLLGLTDKGWIGEGADADLAVVDPRTREVVHTIAGGARIHGPRGVTAAPSRLLTTAHASTSRAAGDVRIDIATSGLYAGWDR
ncbi:amidohydrolase family protein [Sphingomonas sp. BLCC-B65]|nr:amidohydrolase family protein [Sphingomonas sp. BLCC-B65]